MEQLALAMKTMEATVNVQQLQLTKIEIRKEKDNVPKFKMGTDV